MRPPRRLVLIGHPVAQSLSPRIHNAALAAAGIDARYEALDVDAPGLASALEALRADDAAGNVTIPLKELVWRSCARRTPLAERVGAVNTFWFDEGTLHGDNTDVGGIEHVVARLGGWGPRVALYGAGGAAAAVLAAAERAGVREVSVHARTQERAAALASRFAPMARAVADPGAALRGASLVVNASPIGARDDAFPLPVELVPAGARVFDLVYRAGETPWVRACRAAGIEALDGLPMLLEQAALAFTRWFGREPDREVMAAAIRG